MKKVYLVSGSLLFIMVILSFTLANQGDEGLDHQLYSILSDQGYTGQIQKQLEIRLGRKLDPRKIDLGRLIFFDRGLGLHQDNACAGCHAPAFGFGDSQPMAIGVDNNNIVGPHRMGPRNQRRSPSVINTAFFPSLMWNGRFTALSDDPFDNSSGFEFPPPEGDSLFSIMYGYVSNVKHLLVAQAHIPFTELPEMAVFTNTANLILSFSRFSGLSENEDATGHKTSLIFLPTDNKVGADRSVCPTPDFSQFDDGHGLSVPPVDPVYQSSNFGIRAKVLNLINHNPTYIKLFKKIYPQVAHTPVDFIMMGEVIAEFEFFLTFATAPLDKFAVGKKDAMTSSQKRGALIFFGRGNCVSCHAVSGTSNEMFSDFINHNVGTPQIYPVFGLGTGNVPFSEINCPNKTATGTLDFGREEFTGQLEDRYMFRTSPLRNVILQSSFFHNGSFKDLKKAIRYHLDPTHNIDHYSPAANGVPSDLKYKPSDMPNVMVTIDPLLADGISLDEDEFEDVYHFVREALYDDRASPEKLQALIPVRVPSGVNLAHFEERELPHNHLWTAETSDVAMLDAPGSEDSAVEPRLLSNLSSDDFTMVMPENESAENTRLIVTDMNGNVIESRKDFSAGQKFRFGENYQQGIFFAVVFQGEKKVIFKLVKI
ncbi:MAG: cytochrome c peroxidase [Saprospiraceae bacterium]